jgi:hypothetical protein
VKTLPDNPDLDHLRQQAKGMLAGQYGFPNWTDLNSEVDRRQDTADVADPALARELAGRYGLGAVTGEMRSVAPADEMGRRWRLVTDRGRWAVRTMDTWIRIVDHETDVGLQEAAARSGVLLPAPVRSRDEQARRVFERSVAHLLAHMPTRATYERLLEAAGQEGHPTDTQRR